LPAVKQAIVELRRMRAKLDAVEQARTEKIAIVGMGLRLPGAAVDGRSFWRLLEGGVSAITEIPSSRWRVEDYFDPDPDAPGKMYTRHGGFLQEVDGFDAEFFRIAPREAVAMDPQQRLLLEVTWEAFENAAIAPSCLAGGRTGVFIGIGNSDYGRQLLLNEDRIDAYAGTGFAACVAAGRLSYALGLTGPSMAIDTSCSSSLVALAQACVSLRRGECDLAVAGGVNLILTPEVNIAFSKARMMAPDGRCKTFDARADGYVRGEGCAVLVLKRLSDAERDGDPTHALVRGVAVNHDGASSGITVPSGPAQEALIRAALDDARVEPAEVDYIEAHGTATSLGDPIEVHALGAVFGADRPADRPLIVGSVKTNVGHLEAAAGVAGVIKAVLSLEHRRIPPNLHFEEPSPRIDWKRCPFKVPTEPLPWPEKTGPRLAGVSSFGFSGTNAHVVLEQAPTRERPPRQSEPATQVVCLSAIDWTPLRALAKRYADRLQEGGISLSDVALTANTGRSHFTHRLAVLSASRHEAAEQLVAVAEGGEARGCLTGCRLETEPPEVAFLFTGQGAQYVGMGRQLYESQPVFRATMDQCDEVFRAYREHGLLSVLYAADADPARLEQTAYAQPALFALEVSLAALWRSWGVEPSAVLGHSLGEYSAACVAGVFSLEDGLRLTAERGRLMQATSLSGAMAAVFADVDVLGDSLEGYTDRVAVAAINGPENTVLSGESTALSEILDRLGKDGIAFQRLKVSHAFHSPLIEPALEAFERAAREVAYSPPQIPIVSGRTGEMGGQELINPTAWVRQSRQPVQFRRSMESLRREGCQVFVEAGPHPVLLAMGRRCAPDDECAWLPSLRRGRDDGVQILETAASLYVRGVDLVWERVQNHDPDRRVALPTYPFQRDPYWWTSAGQPSRRPQEQVDSWQDAAAAARNQANQVPIDLQVHTYATKWRHLDQLSIGYIVRTLRRMGAFAESGSRHSVDSLMRECGIVSTYRMLVSRWLERLAGDGLLVREGEDFRAETPLPTSPIEPLIEQAKAVVEDVPLLLDYLTRCGELLEDVLLGNESALETLFPKGASDTALYLYRHWSMARYFNGIVASVVASRVRSLAPGETLRIVEIGAGTGSTSASVLPLLPPERTLYCFTDVSDFFLNQARQAFEAYPFVRYGRLNIEQSPAEQGYGVHGFDVVIAANVLHATRHLEETAAHARALLAPGGLLVAVEATDPPFWSDMTVGLIEGWQCFDDDLRTDSPLLSPEQWESLLRSQGFAHVTGVPGEDSPAIVLGSHVIVGGVAQTESTECAEVPAQLLANGERGPSSLPPGGPHEAPSEPAHALREELAACRPNEREERLVNYVRDGVNRVLRRDPTKPLDRRHRLMDLGVDSLMAVELRNVLGTGLGLEQPLPATLVFDYPSVEAIATYLAKLLSAAEEAAEPAAAGGVDEGTTTGVTEEQLHDLSDGEVEALLLKRMDEI